MTGRSLFFSVLEAKSETEKDVPEMNRITPIAAVAKMKNKKVLAVP